VKAKMLVGRRYLAQKYISGTVTSRGINNYYE